MSKEPVILGFLANAIASSVAGFAMKRFGVQIDPLWVSGILLAVGTPLAFYIRSKVSPVAKAAS